MSKTKSLVLVFLYQMRKAESISTGLLISNEKN